MKIIKMRETASPRPKERGLKETVSKPRIFRMQRNPKISCTRNAKHFFVQKCHSIKDGVLNSDIFCIILLGPPGSGKSTIAEQLKREFKFNLISPGELLREEVKNKTTTGKIIQKYIEKGKLVPDQFVLELVKLNLEGKNHYILDGFPRSMDQAKKIKRINLVIYLEVDEKTVVRRLAGRRICKKGKHLFHLRYSPSKKKGVCDYDHSRLIQRKDDQPKVIKKRFLIYNQNTKPVINYYTKKRVLKKINAAAAPEEVYETVKMLIKKHLITN